MIHALQAAERPPYHTSHYSASPTLVLITTRKSYRSEEPAEAEWNSCFLPRADGLTAAVENMTKDLWADVISSLGGAQGRGALRGEREQILKGIKAASACFSLLQCLYRVGPTPRCFLLLLLLLLGSQGWVYILAHIYVSCLLLLCLGLLVSVKRMPRSSCCSVLQLLLVPRTRPNLLWHFKSQQCDFWRFF